MYWGYTMEEKSKTGFLKIPQNPNKQKTKDYLRVRPAIGYQRLEVGEGDG